MLDSMLSKYDVSDVTHWVEIVDEDGEPIAAEDKDPFQIEIVHVENPRYKKERNFLVDKMQGKTKGKKSNNLSADELDEFGLKMAAKMTVSWKNLFDNDGNEIKYSYDAAIELYKNYSFILKQVTEAAEDRSNFIRKS